MIKILLVFIFFLNFFLSSAISFENKILIKVDNEIITSIDTLNEGNYLKAMNKNLQDLSMNELWKISLNSITREKIKKIELLNNVEKIELDDENFDKIVSSIFKRYGHQNIEDFKKYLYSFDVDFEFFKEKVLIETLWNELIYSKFNSQVIIDKEKLKNKIKNDNKKTIKTFHLSEIVFETSDSISVNEKYDLIKKEISEKNFENAALIYSISNTSNQGGNLGWVKEDLISKKLRDEIIKLNIGELSKPIIIPGGVLILKVKDLKEVKNEINLTEKLNELIRYSTNEQLNQFSNIYFNKVKKNIKINEL